MAHRRLLLLVLAAWAAALTASAADQLRTNGEYGFSVRFAQKLVVCEGGSWNHPHGWGVALGGSCKAVSRADRRAIDVLGDYNGAEFATPEAATGCGGAELAAGAKLDLSFEQRPSATCRQALDDGTILIMVVTQAGKLPKAEPGAWINYSANLSTTAATLAEDLVAFRAVLKSVRIRPRS